MGGSDLGGAKVDDPDLEVLAKDNVLGLEVAVDDGVGVQVVNGLKHLGQVVEDDLPLLHGQLQVTVDGPHQLEEISKGAQLQYHPDVFGGVYHLLQPYYPLVLQLLQDHLLNGRLMGLLHFVKLFELHRLEGKHLTSLLVPDPEYLPI